MGCYFLEQISFGDIPNSRNLLFLQIFPQRAVKPSAGNISARSAPKLPGTLLNLIWLCTRRSPVPSPEPVEPDLAPCTKAPADLLRNLLRNPVEPDLALHQSLPSPEPSPEPWIFCGTLLNLTRLCTKASQTFSWTYGTLLKLTWLCTKASQIFTASFSGTLLNLTWLYTKASQAFSGTFSGTWPGSAPKPPRPSPLYFLRNLIRNPIELDLALHQSLPDLHLLRNPVEPDLVTHV